MLLASTPQPGKRIVGRAPVTVHARDDAHCVGTWKNVAISVWRTQTRPAAVARMSQILGELVSRHHDVALIQVVEGGATAPDADARRAISTMLRLYSDSIRCSAVVFESDGFRAATLRAVVTGIALLSRPPYPHVVFASTIAAINWTARHFAADGPDFAEEARDAVSELRRALDRPPSFRPGPGLVTAKPSAAPGTGGLGR